MPLTSLGFLFSAVLFIVGIKMQTKIKSARNGNLVALAGMLVAIVTTLVENGFDRNLGLIFGGLFIGSTVGVFLARVLKMTLMPEYIAFCNGIGAAGSALIALGYVITQKMDMFSLVMSVVGIFVGAFTFSGSTVAILKLSGTLANGKPILFKGMRVLTVLMFALAFFFGYKLIGIGGDDIVNHTETALIWVTSLMATGAAAGILMVLAIGGADMPVVVSLLNSYSGLTGAATGFAMANVVVVITGALIGASGLILTGIMCKAMNRSLANVLFGGFGADTGTAGGAASEYTNVKSTSAEEVAMIMDGADSIIIIPGYGMAVGQAQHAVKELTDELERRGKTVKFAIHPVAGRMPGHMNVLLAEASIDYDKLKPLEDINSEFKNTDVVYIIGANDVVNPAAIEDPKSPIYGMPILNAHEARTVVNVKRSLSPGFAAIKNSLYEKDNSLMLFDDAKRATENVLKELRDL